MTIVRVVDDEMFRLYVGNVDSRATEEAIGELVSEQGILGGAGATANAVVVVLKRGYAFIDCPDQQTFEDAINKLNGYNFLGSVLQVEPSSISKRMRSNRIQISNLPPHMSEEAVHELTVNFGRIESCEMVSCDPETTTTTMMTTTMSAIVTFDTAESAKSAVDQLHNYDYDGSILQVDYVYAANDRHDPTERDQPLRPVDLPLRILVPSDFIGAIIGRKGQTIRNITANCKVRVDVHGKENTGQVEKMISLFGQCSQCSEACKEIMSIMQKESINTNRGDITLKMLIDDRFCGRIIGREGKTIKKVREDTATKITISNVQEMASLYPDRIIAIRGTVENMSKAENAISSKLIECHERDIYSYTRPPGLMPSLSMPSLSATGPGGATAAAYPTPRPVYEPSTGGYYSASSASAAAYGSMPPPPPPLHPPLAIARSPPAHPQFPRQQQQQQPPPTHQHQQPTIETCHIGIPNFAVGAIIGAAGANIKRIIRDSNAFVTVEPRRDDQNPADERIATIKGNSDACWRASYFIFEKMKLEGFAGSDGEVRLRTTILIPRSAAGRVIGKGGKNVREIQRITGAMIKLPADVSHESAAVSQPHQPQQQQQQQQERDEEVTVEVFGNFIATQSAHNRIRSMVSKLSSAPPPPPPPPPPPSSPPLPTPTPTPPPPPPSASSSRTGSSPP